MAAVDPGKALSSSTTRSFVTALVVNGALLGVEVLAFFLLKQKLWRIYGPRTVLPPPQWGWTTFFSNVCRFILFLSSKRAAALPSGIAKWLPALIRYPAEDIVSLPFPNNVHGVTDRGARRYTRMDLMRKVHFFPFLWPTLTNRGLVICS